MVNGIVHREEIDNEEKIMFEVKIYENGKEIDIEALPSGYVRGVIELFKSELTSREREERLWTNLTPYIESEDDGE